MEKSGFEKLTISGWRQFRDIEIDVHPKLTVITGANGAGKSTLLTFFTRHFGYHRNFLATPTARSTGTHFVTGLFTFIRKAIWPARQSADHPVEIGRIRYRSGVESTLRVPANPGLNYSIDIESQQNVEGLHIDSHRPPNIYRHVANFPATPPEVDGIGNGLNNEYMNYYSNGQVQAGSLHHIKMSLIQMSIFGHGNSTMEPIPKLVSLFSGFEEKLKILLPKSLGFKRLIIRSPEIILSTQTGDFLIDAASGGVIKIFEIAWQIYFFSQNKSSFVVTFDEPENHLHPSMQKAFLPNIIAAFPNIQVIAVTHSPFIISAMQDSSVYVLRYVDTEFSEEEVDTDQSIRGLQGSRVIAEKLDTINKAGTASEILRDVLGITTTIPDWAEERVHAIVQGYEGLKFDETTLKELYKQLEGEGLASSYPTAVAALTSPR